MKISSGVLPLLIGSYAKRYGVELMMYGHTAYTNGKQITIPRLDLSDSAGQEMAYGYVAHECGHLVFTDFGCFKDLRQDSADFGMFNALEDARVNFLQTRSWPGLLKTFNFQYDTLKRESCEFLRQLRDAGDLTTLLILYCNYRSHWEAGFTGRGVRHLLRFSHMALLSLLPEAVIGMLNHIIYRVAFRQTSDDVMQVAAAALEFIRKYIRKNNAEYDRAVKKHEAQLSPAEAEEDLFSEQSSMPRSRKVSFERIFKDMDFPKDLLKRLSDDFTEMLNAETPDNAPAGRISRMKALSRTFDGNAPSIAGEIERRSYSTGGSQDFGGTVTGIPRPALNDQLYQKVIRNGSFRYQIESMMRSYDEWMNGRKTSGKEVDVLAYAGRVINNFHVFKSKSIRQCVNTTVHLLVDASGSMAALCPDSNIRRYEVANQVALSLALGMENISNLTSEVTYFPGTYAEFDTIRTPKQSVKSRARYFDQLPHSCTPLTQVLLHAVEKLPEKSPYQRDIIIVITDGKPDCFDTAKKVIDRCGELGVEIYGIGIGENTAVSDLFRESEKVSDAAELPEAMKRLMKRTFFRKFDIMAHTTLAKIMAAKMSHI